MCRCSTAVNARYGRGSLPRWACTKYVRSGQESTSALQSGCRLIPSSVTSGGAVASAAASSVGVTPTCAPSASILRGAKFARRRSSTATPPVLLACAGQCNPKLLSAHERQKPPNWCPFTGRVRFRSRSELPGVPASQGTPSDHNLWQVTNYSRLPIRALQFAGRSGEHATRGSAACNIFRRQR